MVVAADALLQSEGGQGDVDASLNANGSVSRPEHPASPVRSRHSETESVRRALGRPAVSSVRMGERALFDSPDMDPPAHRQGPLLFRRRVARRPRSGLRCRPGGRPHTAPDSNRTRGRSIAHGDQPGRPCPGPEGYAGLGAWSRRCSRPGGLRDSARWRLDGSGVPREHDRDRASLPVRDGDDVYAQLASGERLVRLACTTRGGYMLQPYNHGYRARFVRRKEIHAMHVILYSYRHVRPTAWADQRRRVRGTARGVSAGRG